MKTINGTTSPLLSEILYTQSSYGCSMQALTVLAPANDPFRIDTPASHRDGEWLAITAQGLGLSDRMIHIRGLHYMIIGQPKPDGTPYTNTEKDWNWLASKAAKAARWLGYIGFNQIIDQRNAAPIVRIFEQPDTGWFINVGLDVRIPDAEELVPTIGVEDFVGVQPYKLVLIGEKSSLEPVLAPLASDYHADLYLPTGEPSDTMLHTMARNGAEDCRRMIVFYFSDCDPSGYQMPISVSRKLQAFKTAFFPGLDAKVIRVALTPDQVQEYGLPSTPLKDTERRADRWMAAMGVEQTEIDALAALQPALLRDLAREAVAPYFDSTLNRRVKAARDEWLANAQAALDGQMDEDRKVRMQAQVADLVPQVQEQIDALNEAVRVDPAEFTMPDFDIPDADVEDEILVEDVHGLPLFDTRWTFIRQTERLKAAKAYEDDE